MAVFGLSLTGLGLVASIRNQPLEVMLPPAVTGAVLALISVFAFGRVRHRYGQAELRRMRAMDAATPIGSAGALSGDLTR